ncbi:MAG: hypothetical protein JWN00_690 [Actinomycetia bacterium]|nr:hypothetical protein [Actinomycetes bacterium]
MGSYGTADHADEMIVVDDIAFLALGATAKDDGVGEVARVGALAQGNPAIDLLTAEVDSARCVGHVSRLVDDLAPYRRSPGVREFTARARPFLAGTT